MHSSHQLQSDDPKTEIDFKHGIDQQQRRISNADCSQRYYGRGQPARGKSAASPESYSENQRDNAIEQGPHDDLVGNALWQKLRWFEPQSSPAKERIKRENGNKRGERKE